MSGFVLAQTALSTGLAVAEESVRVIDLMFGSNETSRALASIVMLVAKELSDDYSLATFTSTGKDGKPGKGKILVGTDVTDNYIMLVGGDADKFGTNEKTIDEIWGSFGMYSGGSSGNS